MSLLGFPRISVMLSPPQPMKGGTMSNADELRQHAERSFAPARPRDAKGTALSTIKAEVLVRNEKTARLKALRLAEEAAQPPRPSKPARKTKASSH